MARLKACPSAVSTQTLLRTWQFQKFRLLVQFIRPLLALLLDFSSALLKRKNSVWLPLAESLEIEMLNEIRQRRFPFLLPVVVDLPELLRVHPEFSRHLNLGVSEMMPLSRLNPNLQISDFGRHLVAPLCSLSRCPLDAGVPLFFRAANVYHPTLMEDDSVFFRLRIIEMDHLLHTFGFEFPNGTDAEV
jgi:hypothetical protein